MTVLRSALSASAGWFVQTSKGVVPWLPLALVLGLFAGWLSWAMGAGG